MTLKNFYKGKKILVTGHTGFKGSWLTACLLELDAKIMGFSKNDEKIKNYKKICYHNKVKNVYSDITNFKFLKKKLSNLILK